MPQNVARFPIQIPDHEKLSLSRKPLLGPAADRSREVLIRICRTWNGSVGVRARILGHVHRKL